MRIEYDQYDRPDPFLLTLFFSRDPFLLTTVESITGIQRQEFCSLARSALVVAARETLVVSGRRLGATTTMLARLAGLDIACISRRYDAAIRKMKDDRAFSDTMTRVIEEYQRKANRV